MARIQLGPLLSTISGKLGGVVFRGTGNRATLATAPARRKSETLTQQENRLAMSAAFKAWATLTAPERLSWYWFGRLTAAGKGVEPTSGDKAQGVFVRWASGHALLGLAPAITWPRTDLYNPAVIDGMIFWDDLDWGPGVYLYAPQDWQPLETIVWFTPLRAVTYKKRGGRIEAANTPKYGGVWQEFDPGGPQVAWYLDMTARAEAVTAQYPPGTRFQVDILTTRPDGAIFRQQLRYVVKPN